MSYAELHAKSNFSFLEGASHPEELVERAAELGYAALAVTDRNSLAGVVRAHVAAKQLGMKLVIGAEITPDGAPPLVLWPTDRAAYGRLARLITLGRRRAEKGSCRLTLEDVAGYSEGMIAGVCLEKWEEWRSGKWEVASGKWREISGELHSTTPHSSLPTSLFRYRDIFPGRCYLLAELHYRGDDQGYLDRLAAISQETNVPLVAAGDVYFQLPSGSRCATCWRPSATAARWPRPANCYFPTPSGICDRRRKWPRCSPTLPGGLAIARWKSPTAARFRSTSCATSIPKSLAPPGLTPMRIPDRSWPGPARDRRYPARRAGEGSRAASSTNCG